MVYVNSTARVLVAFVRRARSEHTQFSLKANEGLLLRLILGCILPNRDGRYREHACRLLPPSTCVRIFRMLSLWQGSPAMHRVHCWPQGSPVVNLSHSRSLCTDTRTCLPTSASCTRVGRAVIGVVAWEGPSASLPLESQTRVPFDATIIPFTCFTSLSAADHSYVLSQGLASQTGHNQPQGRHQTLRRLGHPSTSLRSTQNGCLQPSLP